MASTAALLLLLLLVSEASASHHFGGLMTYTYRGQNPDGTFKVDFHSRSTFRYCGSYWWNCHRGNCGTTRSSQAVVVDKNSNTQYYGGSCETEKVITRHISSDKPFQMRADSCCWVRTANWVSGWRLLTEVDLGTRSDTRKPNRSPDIAILPLLRVPQNCPRTYKLTSFDPDGDKVQCRYGKVRGRECSSCVLPSGFLLDQASCSLTYNRANTGVYGLELVVEDFPRGYINLQYGDGSRSLRGPQPARRRKRAATPYPYPYLGTTPPSYPYPGTTPPPYPYRGTTPPSYPYRGTTPPPYPYPGITQYPGTNPPPYPYPGTTRNRTRTTTTPPYPYPTRTRYPYPTTTRTRYPYPTTTRTRYPYPTTTRYPYPTTTRYPYPTTTRTRYPYPTTTRYPYPTTTRTRYPTTPSYPYPTTTRTRTPYPTTPLSTAPLSKLPMQFSVLVDPPAPSCTEGAFLPMFLPPTPADGARVRAEVNKELEIRVRAQATQAGINDITVSGPGNISKHRDTNQEFVIRWTPLPEDHGQFFVICFAVEAVNLSAVYQSQMRCVVVDVGGETVKSHVSCSESSMTVSVERASFPRLQEDHLRLNDPSNTACSLQTHSNSTHIVGVVPLNACGTQIEEDEENLIFKNEITTQDKSGDLITRKHLLEVQFYCQYPKRGNVSLSFVAHRRNITVWEKGFGRFTYQFEFYHDNRFQTSMDPNSYPLEYEVGKRIYMKIEATSSINNTELFVESCRAAPYDIPNYHPSYSIFENGCEVDPTVQIHSSGDHNEFQFSMEAFKFIGSQDQVYISCSVMMCEAGNSLTRCSRGCINSTASGRQRGKREAIIQSASHFVSQGPLRLRRSAERAGATGADLNLNLVFVAGCVLAAVAMVCAVVVYRSRGSKVKYQPLPTFEN